MRNVYELLPDNVVSVALPNVTGSAHVLLDAESVPKFDGKRLRWLTNAHGCHVMTTTMRDDYEVGICASNIILDVPKSTVVSYCNGNPCDLRLENLEIVNGKPWNRTMKPNRIYHRKDGAAYLALMDDAYTLTIDADQIPRISQYQWRLHKGRVVGREINRKSGSEMNLALDRFICGIAKHDSRVVKFKNGDVTDYRRHNLKLVSKKKGKSGVRISTGTY